MSKPKSYTSVPPVSENKADPWSDAHAVESARRQRSPPSRRGANIVLCLGMAALAAVLTYSVLAVSTEYCGVSVVPEVLPTDSYAAPPSVLRGPPTASFRDNLRNDTKYITSWHNAGWTNDVMTMSNLLYLASLTGRVPILPPFTPSHVDKDAGPIPFGEVFDVPRLSREMYMPIVEWHDVKQKDSPVVDEMGGWSVWDTVKGEVRGNHVARVLNLDISYSKVPEYAIVGWEDHVWFWALARLGFPTDFRWAVENSTPRPAPDTGAVLAPDEQLLCFDFVYYVCVVGPGEYEQEYSPAWKAVMTHMHWAPQLQSVTDEVLRSIFDVPASGEIPPFISLHARHGDFISGCHSRVIDECFTPLATWDAYVQDVRAALRTKKGIDVREVVMTSDEKDEGWWDAVRALGWRRVDHAALDTVAKYGKWYPVFIDAVIQSAGTGFVGSSGSTMSLLARRRVEDWQGGVGAILPRIYY